MIFLTLGLREVIVLVDWRAGLLFCFSTEVKTLLDWERLIADWDFTRFYTVVFFVDLVSVESMSKSAFGLRM